MSAPTDFNAGTVLTGRKRWAALAFLALGVSMIILDATIVNVAIPTMVQDLGLTTSDAEWVSAAYSLTFASLLILSGRIADRSGRKLLFMLGVVVFVAASVLVAASDSANTLIAARALQGIGGAMILPSSLSVINAVFVGKDRADRLRRLGRHDRRHGGPRAAGRRLADDVRVLALGVPHQRPDRHHRAGRRLHDRARDQGAGRPEGLRHPRHDPHHRGPVRPRVRPDRGPALRLDHPDRDVLRSGLDLALDDDLHRGGRRRARRHRARRVRRPRAASGARPARSSSSTCGCSASAPSAPATSWRSS